MTADLNAVLCVLRDDHVVPDRRQHRLIVHIDNFPTRAPDHRRQRSAGNLELRSRDDALVELDLAKRRLILRDVLLQHVEKRLRLLRAQINSLKIAQLNLRFRTLLHRSKHEKKVPDIHADLHAVRIGFAIFRCVDEFHIRLRRCIHSKKCTVSGGIVSADCLCLPMVRFRKFLRAPSRPWWFPNFIAHVGHYGHEGNN